MLLAAACGTISGWMAMQFLHEPSSKWMMTQSSYESERRKAKMGARLIAALAAVAAFFEPGGMLAHGHHQAIYMRAMAPKVSSFGSDIFDKVDRLNSGTITDSDLKEALKQLELTSEQRQLLKFMENHLPEVGHVTSSYTNTSIAWISTGNGGGMLSTIVTTAYTFGISPSDLKTYPDRVKETYRRW
jgi:hypothetical protein